jgi:hypothetical protein
MISTIKKLFKKEMTEQEALFNRVDDLMQRLVGREEYSHDAQTIRELFNLHNEVFPTMLEYSVSCGGCRERVYNRLRDWWQSNGGVKNI